MVSYGVYDSPLGKGLAAWNKEGVLRVAFPGLRGQAVLSSWETEYGSLREEHSDILDELSGFLQSEIVTFRSRPVLQGTEFQKRVWNSLLKIPYGQTRTYGELALEIGAPGAARAVGSACGKNLLPLLIPCHRVIAGSGLGGFGGGLAMKSWLLEMETAKVSQSE